MGWNENKHASLKRELIYASAAGESLAKQLNLEYFALSKDPKVFFPLELNLHLEVVFFFFFNYLFHVFYKVPLSSRYGALFIMS